MEEEEEKKTKKEERGLQPGDLPGWEGGGSFPRTLPRFSGV